MASSKMYRVDQDLQPTDEWYRASVAELVIMAKEMEIKFKVNYEIAYNSLVSHHNQGGLFIRKIKKQ